MSERPKLTFLAEIAREELQKKGHCSYLDCIFWSPDSRDALNAVGTEVLRVLKPLGIHAAVKALAAQTNEISAHKGNSSWRCRRRTSRRPTPGGNMMLLIPPIAADLAGKDLGPGSGAQIGA